MTNPEKKIWAGGSPRGRNHRRNDQTYAGNPIAAEPLMADLEIQSAVIQSSRVHIFFTIRWRFVIFRHARELFIQPPLDRAIGSTPMRKMPRSIRTVLFISKDKATFA